MSLSRFCAVALLVLSSAVVQAAAPKQMSVVVKVTQVRSSPSYLGKVLGDIAYGERVSVLELRKDWARIDVPSRKLSGWTNLSALTEKRIVLSSGSGNVDQSASSGEVALAGKGFNSQIEAEYRQDGKLDYSWVDKMGKITETPEAVSAFLQTGGLDAGGLR
ncbi:MAG TPA: SH3 domain-containing protein [Rectinemataceae bacterium]|nr:SH3 domain-containing protein [Rectinemataceae bacterium]